MHPFIKTAPMPTAINAARPMHPAVGMMPSPVQEERLSQEQRASPHDTMATPRTPLSLRHVSLRRCVAMLSRLPQQMYCSKQDCWHAFRYSAIRPCSCCIAPAEDLRAHFHHSCPRSLWRSFDLLRRHVVTSRSTRRGPSAVAAPRWRASTTKLCDAACACAN
jgi:hypothetical protein